LDADHQHWQPDIRLVSHPLSGRGFFSDVKDSLKRGKLTRLLITLDRRRRGLDADGRKLPAPP
jgi:hypothetical protein